MVLHLMINPLIHRNPNITYLIMQVPESMVYVYAISVQIRVMFCPLKSGKFSQLDGNCPRTHN